MKNQKPTVTNTAQKKQRELEQIRSQLVDLEAQRIEADRKLRDATNPGMPALPGKGWVER
jgi:hypothetical protein